MHQNNCVHRDLKLENMLLTDLDVVKICDFGWSAEVEIEKMLKTTCGTTNYWAPEIWESVQQDESVDMWSLGCLLYEMLAGHAPFHEQDQLKLKQKVLAVEFGYPPWFSNEACHMVHILLQRSPSHRVTSAELLKHPWLSKYKEKPPHPTVEAPKLLDPPSARTVGQQQPQSRTPKPTPANGPVSSYVMSKPVSRVSGAPEPLLSYSDARAASPVCRKPAETMMAVPAAHGARLASPARSPARQIPLPVSRSTSPMLRTDSTQQAKQCTSPLHPDAKRRRAQLGSFSLGREGAELDEQPPWSTGFQGFGAATGSRGTTAFGALPLVSAMVLPQSPVSSHGLATFSLGSAMVPPQSPADFVKSFGGTSGSSVIERTLDRDAARDFGRSRQGVHTSIASRQWPPTASPPQGYAPTPLVGSGPQWHSVPGRDLGGLVRQPVPPVPQSPAPVHTRANLATTPTAAARVPGAAGAPYVLPHSSSGRLAPLGSLGSCMMMMPQQLGFGTGTYGASPRARVFT